MKMDVFPGELAGTIKVPGSKSVAQRMVAAALMAPGETIIQDYPDSADCQAVAGVAQSLGAVVTRKGNDLVIKGGFPHAQQNGIRYPKTAIQCGESGLASRMFIPICALHDERITINGEGSLLQRPFDIFADALPQLGASIQTTNNHLPIKVTGPLQGGNIEIDGSLSSQFLTGLLMALPMAKGNSIIEVSNLTSQPYIDTTLEVAELGGIIIKHKKYRSFTIEGNQTWKPGQWRVPGDWSGAAFYLVAAAMCSHEGILIENLSDQFSQADMEVLDVLRNVGALVDVSKKGVFVRKNHIKAFEWDGTHCPDLFPCLVALAAAADGVSTFKGVKRLFHKESNRAKVLHDEFAKANIRIVIRDDEMKVYPGAIRHAVINAHNDHRIAMAASLLALLGDRITIVGAECVAKSFVQFFDVWEQLGGRLVRR